MSIKEKEAIWEGVKNGIRNMWFAIFPVLLTGIDIETGTFAINWMVVCAAAAVSIITTIDGIMHEWGKLKKDEALEKGLSFGV